MTRLSRILFLLLVLLSALPVLTVSGQSNAPLSEADGSTTASASATGPAELAPPPGAAPGSARQSPAEIAAAAYARSDWQTAIAQYRALLAEGYVDPALYYNLGTAYARSGDVGRAVWMLLRARRLDPRDPAIGANLRKVAPDLPSQMAVFPVPPLEALYRSLSLNEWAIFAALATILAAAACFVFLRTKPVNRWRNAVRRLAVVCALLALLGHAFAALKYDEEVLQARGIVTDPNTQPHAGPSDASEVYKFNLPPGTLIQIRNAGAEGWVKAVYGGKNEVFIRTGQFERL